MLKDSHWVHLNNLDSRWSFIPFLWIFFFKLILTQMNLSRSLKLLVCPEIMKARCGVLMAKCPEIGIGQRESQGRVRSTVEIIYLREKRTLML